MTSPARRVVEVAPERYAAWRARFEARNPEPTPAQRIEDVEAFDHDPFVVLAIRRGGYAVALVTGGAVTTRKVGTRHVQSRTAAGGWSQQRFARRRDNQADALVRAVADHAVRVMDGIRPAAVVWAGDRALVAELADDSRLVRLLGELPQRHVHGIPDPTAARLDDLIARARATRVTVVEAVTA